MIKVLIICYKKNHMIIYTCIESTGHTPNIFTSLYVICISIKMFKGTKTSFSLTALPFAPPTPAPSTFPSSLSPLHSQTQSWAGRLWFGA